MSNQYKSISLDEVAVRVAESRNAFAKQSHALALAGIHSGVTVAPFDAAKPFVLWTRFKKEGQDAEVGWGVHPQLRFRTPGGAAAAAEDLMKLDPSLEIRIECQVPPIGAGTHVPNTNPANN